MRFFRQDDEAADGAALDRLPAFAEARRPRACRGCRTWGSGSDRAVGAAYSRDGGCRSRCAGGSPTRRCSAAVTACGVGYLTYQNPAAAPSDAAVLVRVLIIGTLVSAGVYAQTSEIQTRMGSLLVVAGLFSSVWLLNGSSNRLAFSVGMLFSGLAPTLFCLPDARRTRPGDSAPARAPVAGRRGRRARAWRGPARAHVAAAAAAHAVGSVCTRLSGQRVLPRVQVRTGSPTSWSC